MSPPSSSGFECVASRRLRRQSAQVRSVRALPHLASDFLLPLVPSVMPHPPFPSWEIFLIIPLLPPQFPLPQISPPSSLQISPHPPCSSCHRHLQPRACAWTRYSESMHRGHPVLSVRSYPPFLSGATKAEYPSLPLLPPFPSSSSEATLFSQFACQVPISPMALSCGSPGFYLPLWEGVLTCPRPKASSGAGELGSAGAAVRVESGSRDQLWACLGSSDSAAASLCQALRFTSPPPPSNGV